MDRRWDKLLRFDSLINILKHESRFIIQEPYKTFVNSIVQKVHEEVISIIPANTILFRARINEINFIDRMEERIPFPAEKMGPPPHQLAISGRINPEGIPYLYCAGDIETAGAELRPWKGAYLTIGEVKINNDITIADLTLDCKDEEWNLFFDEFTHLFSIQWPPELKLNYLVSQYFTEHFKSVGLRGIRYNSEFNVGGNNYALFYKEDYDIVKTYSVETSEISFYFYKDKVL